MTTAPRNLSAAAGATDSVSSAPRAGLRAAAPSAAQYNDNSASSARRRLAAWLAALCAAVLPATLAGCSSGTAEATNLGKGGAQGPPPALVRVAMVEQRPVVPRLNVVGSVLPRRTSIVASGSDGVVAEFPVDAGQFVEQGTVLSRLRMETTDLEIEEAKALLAERQAHLQELEAGSRPEDIAEADARQAVARAALTNAEAKRDRIQQLFDRKAANQDELDDAKERLQAAQKLFEAAKAAADRTKAGPRREEIDQARARFEAQKAHVAYLEAEKEKRTTRAPFSGYISKSHSYLGQWLSKGDPVVTLTLLDTVDVAAMVDQRDLGLIRLGEKAQFRVKGIEPAAWEGTIVQIIPRSEWETGSRGFPVVVRLKNEFRETQGRRRPVLKEGMMAEFTFSGPPVDATLVPKDAVVRTTRGNQVYVFQPEGPDPNKGKARLFIVETGVSDGTSIQVTAEGLVAGMQVVVEGAQRLRPFQDVQIAAAGQQISEEDAGAPPTGSAPAEGAPPKGSPAQDAPAGTAPAPGAPAAGAPPAKEPAAGESPADQPAADAPSAKQTDQPPAGAAPADDKTE